MKRYIFLISTIFYTFSLSAQANNPDLILGVWKSPMNNLMIKIDKVGNHFQGRIVWLEAKAGNQLALDANNPEERLRMLPLKGNKIIKELSFDSSKSSWEGGTFYSHEEGKLYNCNISVHSDGRIKIIKYNQNLRDGVVEIWTHQ